MVEERTFQKTFTICQKHLDFLETRGKDSVSEALRSEIDKLLKPEKKKMFDDMVIYMAFGMLFLILSMLITIFTAKVLAVGFGAFFLAYGGIGGLINVLRAKK